jgi:hypothetical protein
MNLASYLMLVGIYDSARLVSSNNQLRISVYKNAMESKLLGPIGDAEIGKLIEKTVNNISKRKDKLEENTQQILDLDQTELKKYVDFVIKEVREKGNK